MVPPFFRWPLSRLPGTCSSVPKAVVDDRIVPVKLAIHFVSSTAALRRIDELGLPQRARWLEFRNAGRGMLPDLMPSV